MMTEQQRGNLVLAVFAAIVIGALLLWGVLDNTPTGNSPSFPQDCFEVYGPNGMECG